MLSIASQHHLKKKRISHKVESHVTEEGAFD